MCDQLIQKRTEEAEKHRVNNNNNNNNENKCYHHVCDRIELYKIHGEIKLAFM